MNGLKKCKNIKVLLINDEIFILEIFSFLLLKESIEDIDTAYNGFEGYIKIRYKNYDLLISDLNLPEMDGCQFCSNTVKLYKEQMQLFNLK